MSSLSERETRLLETARPYLLQGRPNDWEHTLRALEFGKTLLAEEGGDPEIVIPALILHDIGWSRVSKKDFFQAPILEKKDTPSARAHMEQGALLAGEILQEFEIPDEKMGKILAIIAHHDQREFIQSQGLLEAVLVFEADRLDRFGPESLSRYEEMFGPGFSREGLRYLLEGAKVWFRTSAAKRLAREIIERELPGSENPEY
jgi:HD superfamily phosphohydrolase YqeK